MSAVAPGERARLRAELDGLVAHLFGLTEEEFAHILSTFPVVPQETKDAALAAYRELAPKTADAELAGLFLGGEGPRVEFKSTLRWDLKENRKNPDLEKVVVKTVAGFLNAEGGTLLLGVADDGTPLGLERDYQSLSKSNRDGFGLHLTSLLLDRLGRDLAPCVRLTFHDLEGKDLCRVEITRSPRPVLIKEGNVEAFYLRTGNSTRQLSLSELLAYQKSRWVGGDSD
jgi:predicted HTH transcriptional regulator